MSIEIICGPMFSGKTEELIRRITRAKYARQTVITFKPDIDQRYSLYHIQSHSGSQEECIIVKDSNEILKTIEKEKPDLIAIEEAQFFEHESFVNTIKTLNANRINVIVAGLDMDFMGNPFENIIFVMGIAQKVDKISAVCVVCGNEGTMTYKKNLNSKRVEVGETNLYEARCYDCWHKRLERN